MEVGGRRGGKSGKVFSRLEAEGGGGRKGKFLLPFRNAPKFKACKFYVLTQKFPKVENKEHLFDFVSI